MGKKGFICSLLVYDIIFYMENSEENTQKPVRTNNKVQQVVRVQEQYTEITLFLYTCSE